MSLISCFIGLTLFMESISSQKKSLAALLADKKDHRRVVLLYGRDDAQHYLLDQQDQFHRQQEGLAERDIDVIVVVASELMEPDRQFLMAAPYKLNPAADFKGWLIGKDGGVKDSFDKPVTSHDLFKTVDQMPMRRQEMKHE